MTKTYDDLTFEERHEIQNGTNFEEKITVTSKILAEKTGFNIVIERVGDSQCKIHLIALNDTRIGYISVIKHSNGSYDTILVFE